MLETFVDVIDNQTGRLDAGPADAVEGERKMRANDKLPVAGAG